MISITPYARCAKNFNPVKIIPMFQAKESDEFSRYIVLDRKSDGFIGQFNFWKDGKITDLKFVENIKRKKTIADAILSIRNFVIKKGKEENLDSIDFKFPIPDKRDKTHLKRLCENLGAILTNTGDIAEYHFVGILKPNKKTDIIKKAATETKKSINKTA